MLVFLYRFLDYQDPTLMDLKLFFIFCVVSLSWIIDIKFRSILQLFAVLVYYDPGHYKIWNSLSYAFLKYLSYFSNCRQCPKTNYSDWSKYHCIIISNLKARVLWMLEILYTFLHMNHEVMQIDQLQCKYLLLQFDNFISFYLWLELMYHVFVQFFGWIILMNADRCLWFCLINLIQFCQTSFSSRKLLWQIPLNHKISCIFTFFMNSMLKSQQKHMNCINTFFHSNVVSTLIYLSSFLCKDLLCPFSQLQVQVAKIE